MNYGSYAGVRSVQRKLTGSKPSRSCGAALARQLKRDAWFYESKRRGGTGVRWHGGVGCADRLESCGRSCERCPWTDSGAPTRVAGSLCFRGGHAGVLLLRVPEAELIHVRPETHKSEARPPDETPDH